MTSNTTPLTRSDQTVACRGGVSQTSHTRLLVNKPQQFRTAAAAAAAQSAHVVTRAPGNADASACAVHTIVARQFQSVQRIKVVHRVEGRAVLAAVSLLHTRNANARQLRTACQYRFNCCTVALTLKSIERRETSNTLLDNSVWHCGSPSAFHCAIGSG